MIITEEVFIMLLSFISGLLIVNIICWFVRLTICVQYRKRCLPLKNCDDSLSGINLVVLIPVLNEEKRIHSCIANCKKIAEATGLTVIFATSCSERREQGRENTIDIIHSYQKQYDWIREYQCPYPGVMAHQLNFAIKSFQRESASDLHTLYALYNVDSTLSLPVLSWVCSHYAEAKSSKVIFQQYGCYTKNWNDIVVQPWYFRGILLANMLWQTRWSIGFEMPHALMGQRISNNGIVWMLNYCIGHGLFFNDDVYRIVGGFEEETMNEDAVFGLQACLHNIPIVPVPELELADSPDMVSSLLHQKTTWIYGPAQAFTYHKLIHERYPELSDVDRIRLKALCLQLFEHSLRWVALPVLVLLGLVLCLKSTWMMNLLYGTVLLFYLGGFDLFCLIFLPHTQRPRFIDVIPIIYGALVQFEMHGLSGLIGFTKLIWAYFAGSSIEKHKTEMK